MANHEKKTFTNGYNIQFNFFNFTKTLLGGGVVVSEYFDFADLKIF